MTPQEFQYPPPFYYDEFSLEGENIPSYVEKSNKKYRSKTELEKMKNPEAAAYPCINTQSFLIVRSDNSCRGTVQLMTLAAIPIDDFTNKLKGK